MLKENQFLVCGSGSGGGTPMPFCHCSLCTYAREHGGPDLRTRAGYQLGEKIRFDWSPDVAWQAHALGLDFSNLKYLFITHSHSDHFYAEDFWTRHPQVSETSVHILKIFGNHAVGEKLRRDAGNYEACGIEFQELAPFETVTVEHTSVTALPADHIPTETAFLYLIEQNGRRLLLGHDSQLYPQNTMDFLRDKYCDYFLPDATWGTERRTKLWGHMGLYENLELFQMFVQQKSMNEKTLVFPTHIAPHKGNFHHQLVDFLKPYGNFSPAYDGMMLELGQ